MIKISLSLFLTQYVMQFMKDNTNKEEQELEIIQYGIEVFFINLFKFIVLISVAFVLGVIKPLIILFISFGCIRIFAAGVHAPSTFICTLLNFILFLGGTYLCLYIPIDASVRIGLFLVSLLIIVNYAPADTEERPLISTKHRHKLKCQAIIAVVGLFLVMLFIKDEIYKNLITCGVLLAAMLTTPVIYHILGKGYKNYEKFNEQNYGN